MVCVCNIAFKAVKMRFADSHVKKKEEVTSTELKKSVVIRVNLYNNHPLIIVRVVPFTFFIIQTR